MAAFACFSTSKEKTTGAYKALIKRFKQKTQEELGDPNKFRSATFKYFSEHKGRSVHNYKDFIYELRKAVFNVACIILCDNPCYQLKHYIVLIEQVKLLDGENACALYGEMKKIVTSFVNYFTHIIDDVVRKIDKYNHTITNTKLLSLIDKTIQMAEENQKEFTNEYLPINSPEEQEKHDEIVEKNDIYMEELKKIRVSWEGVHKQDTIEGFIKVHFKISIKKISDLCNFTHTYISMMLSDRLYEIAVSVEMTVDRLTANMRKYDEQCNINTNQLIQDLYDKNKENLAICRRDRLRSIDAEEVKRSIEVIKDKIEQYGNEETIARLVLETRYWLQRLKEFHEVSSMVMKLNIELDKVNAEEEKYKGLRTIELPGSKTKCFDTIGENFQERKSYLQEKLVAVSRALITFFCVRGTDRILYTDNIGSYYCDEFNHQNYITDYGLKFFHVNCVGEFLENFETDPYYFDENGRYIIENGEKIHQCAPCTSQYKLGEDGRFKKITIDCGHSEQVNDKCRMEIKDLTDVEILPKTDIIDISKSLDSESVKYLWDSVGMLLPEVLYDLATALPKNPIHLLAHILIKRRFDATNEELAYAKKLAEKYRTNIHKERKENAAEARRKWRAKLVKRRKPEEFDDTQEWATYNQQVADWQFVNSLGYYNQ